MGSREWGDEGTGEAGDAKGEEINKQCPMPNAQNSHDQNRFMIQAHLYMGIINFEF